MVDEELIARITREVLARIPNAPQPKTLVVFPGYLYEQDAVAKHLAEKHGSAEVALFGDAAVRHPQLTVVETGTQAQRQQLAMRLSGYENIVIVTPPLEYLYVAAEGDDSRLDTALMLRPLLWRKKVTLLLDYVPPRNRSGFSRLTDSLEMLQNMGATIETLPRLSNAGGEAKELVSAQDIRDAAAGSGYIRLAPRAIITPLAADMAKELDVTIER